MARRRGGEAERRLLEAWVPPDGAGEAIGCVATTFTFDPVFFEEHCLSRFLRLETDPREDGAAYLINREEKLAATTVSVLVDRSNAEGSASPRWDVLPVTVPGGICHAKVSVLAWHNWIRVLVGSANLTEPAYRKNQEVFGVLDFREGGEVPGEVLDQMFDFLRRLSDLAPGTAAGLGPKARLLALLDRLTTLGRQWIRENRRDWPQVIPVLLGPMNGFEAPIPERLGRLVRDRGGPAHSASVLSPFFDKDDTGTYPATQALLAALRERGDRHLEFLVPVERLPDGRIRVRAPRSLVRSGRKAAEIVVCPVEEDVDREVRPLHAKSLWLWNDGWHAHMVGSSNFTTAGLGLRPGGRNVEANLAYVFPEDGGLVRLMEATLPPLGGAIDDLDAALWEPVGEAEGEDPTVTVPLPLGFEEALFEPSESGGVLTLRVSTALPSRWTVSEPKSRAQLYSSEQWLGAGSPAAVELTWSSTTVPNAVDVGWWDQASVAHSAPWPVNVMDLSRLLPPADLWKLSLETLIEILGSRLPLHEAVKRAREQAAAGTGQGGDELPPEIDPHRRVRTETFLLQRTRRVARAVEQLVENLNRPVVHRDALLWRLRGPVGPLALARALAQAARSPGEACFLLAEVVLALRRVDVRKVAVGLDPEEVDGELDAVKAEIDGLARRHLEDERTPRPMAEYVLRALEEARR
jgi:hypothetical protein